MNGGGPPRIPDYYGPAPLPPVGLPSVSTAPALPVPGLTDDGARAWAQKRAAEEEAIRLQLSGQVAPPPAPSPVDPAALKYWGSEAAARAATTPPAAPAKTWEQNQAEYDAAHQPASAPTNPTGIAALREGSKSANAAAQGAPPETKAPPSKEQNAAAAALTGYGAGHKTAARQPVITGGVAPGDGGQARRELYGTFAAEKHAMQSLADAEMARSEAMAAGMAVIGADRVRESALQESRAASEREIFKSYQEDTQRQLDDVRSQKVDPNRLYRDTGSTALAIIGGVLGGLYQGLNKLSSNPFIDQMNRNIDRDIAVQERDLDRKTKAIGERRGILADMRVSYHDEDMARAQAKNLYYEGIKQQLAAQASQYESPAIQARADQAINLVDRQQAALKLDELAKRAAANAAAAAFARAEKQREFENALKQEEAITHRIAANKSGVGHKEGQSPRERFVGVDRDDDGNPRGYLAGSGTEAAKARQQLAASNELIALAEKAKAVRAEQGFLGRSLVREPLVGTYTPEWQTKIRSLENQIVGAIKKSEELGALDNGVERFAKPLAGNLDSYGSSADDRLDTLIEATKTKMKVHTNQLSGQQAVMLPGEEVVQTGRANSPENLKGSSGVERKAP